VYQNTQISIKILNGGSNSVNFGVIFGLLWFQPKLNAVFQCEIYCAVDQIWCPIYEILTKSLILTPISVLFGLLVFSVIFSGRNLLSEIVYCGEKTIIGAVVILMIFAPIWLKLLRNRCNLEIFLRYVFRDLYTFPMMVFPRQALYMISDLYPLRRSHIND